MFSIKNFLGILVLGFLGFTFVLADECSTATYCNLNINYATYLGSNYQDEVVGVQIMPQGEILIGINTYTSDYIDSTDELHQQSSDSQESTDEKDYTFNGNGLNDSAKASLDNIVTILESGKMENFKKGVREIKLYKRNLQNKKHQVLFLALDKYLEKQKDKLILKAYKYYADSNVLEMLGMYKKYVDLIIYDLYKGGYKESTVKGYIKKLLLVIKYFENI